MSLSRLIEANPSIKKSFPMLKPYLHDINGCQLGASDWEKLIQVPSIGESYEKGLIGTAFDYVARAVLAKKLGRVNITLEKMLVAEKGLHSFAGLSKYRIPRLLTKNPIVNEERIIGQEIVFKKSKEIQRYLQQEFDLSVKVRERFIDGSETLSNFIQRSIFLARLDEAYRCGSVHIADEYFRLKKQPTYFSQYATIDNNQIADNLYKMALVFQEIIEQQSYSYAILNPEFGHYSRFLSGADADFIVDDLLVDIKTGDKLRYVGDDFTQLFAYAAMARAIGLKVNKVAIYFARFGYFALINVEDPILGDGFLTRFLDIIMRLK
ncbi:MAG TPA: hypothetical protein GX523_18175 [Desulfitobacterium dehalogenans]|uniref:Uncharacterized protein n=1 Tax=Desulfitobacterium dehalogenans TaxID=36854 RepID=A0A7C6Z6S7_9FIRM|nr:hypothetical protein [Desulfitobacterium dehalogenans]